MTPISNRPPAPGIPDAGPLSLRPVFLPKVWAAAQLDHPLAAVLTPPPKTGEIWLASDRHSVTPIKEGPMEGMGLDEATSRWPGWFLGNAHSRGLPILVKLLNAGDWLSVQVHPDDDDARAEGEPWGKSECWRVLAAREESQIVLGLRPGLERAELEEAIRAGEISRTLARIPARVGDCFHLQAGMVHATGPGLVIFELQQASDVTYRFYDWDRLGDGGVPRELHLDKALAAMKDQGPGGAAKPRVYPQEWGQSDLLVEDPHFRLWEHHLMTQGSLPDRQGRVGHVFVLKGAGELRSPQGAFASKELHPGSSWLIPAGLGSWLVQPAGGGITLLESQG